MTSTGIASAGHVRTSRRRRPQEGSSNLRVGIATAIAAAGGLAAAFLFDASATGTEWIDACYRAAFVVLLSLLASRSRRLAWLVSAAIVAPLGSDPLTIAIGTLALVLAFAGTIRGRRNRVLGSVVGALVGLASLGLADGGTLGMSAVAATCAAAVLAVSGLQNLRTRPKRVLFVGTGAFIAVTAVLSVAGGFALLQARTSLDEGAQQARTGLSAFRDGNDERASEKLIAASDNFRRASDETTSGLARGGAMVPILGQHLRAVSELSDHSAALSTTIAGTAGVLEAVGVTQDGKVDLARVAELVPQAESIAAGLDDAKRTIDDVQSPWLIGPLQEAIGELDAEISTSLPQVVNARDALAVAPEFLGGNGARLYLTIVGNPAEARELGGFAGSFGLLSAEGGDFEFDQISTRSLARALREQDLGPRNDDPPTLTAAEPEVFPQNWTAWPEFDIVSDRSAELFEAALGLPIDGVLYLDPYALAALLDFTGPVRIPEVPEPITAENAAGFMMRDQYGFFVDDGGGERKELLGDVAEKAFDELTEGALPEPRLLAQRLGPLVAQHRLFFRPIADDAPTEFLDRIGLTGTAPHGFDTPSPTLVDDLVVTHTNLRANKLDAYVSRRIGYSIDIDPESESANATVRVEVTNNAPETPLPDTVIGDGNQNRDGLPLLTAQLDVAVHTAMPALAVTTDNEPTGVNSTLVGEKWRHSATIEVPRGETVVVEFSLADDIDLESAPIVRFNPNGSALPDRFSANITLGEIGRSFEERVLDQTVDVRLVDH